MLNNLRYAAEIKRVHIINPGPPSYEASERSTTPATSTDVVLSWPWAVFLKTRPVESPHWSVGRGKIREPRNPQVYQLILITYTGYPTVIRTLKAQPRIDDLGDMTPYSSPKFQFVPSQASSHDIIASFAFPHTLAWGVA